jgi:hypothetical protein
MFALMLAGDGSTGLTRVGIAPIGWFGLIYFHISYSIAAILMSSSHGSQSLLVDKTKGVRDVIVAIVWVEIQSYKWY